MLIMNEYELAFVYVSFFFSFLFVTFFLVFFSFFFLSVSFRFFSFFSVSQFTGTRYILLWRMSLCLFFI